MWLTVHTVRRLPCSAHASVHHHLLQHSPCVSEAVLMLLHCNSIASDANGDWCCIYEPWHVSQCGSPVQYVPSQYCHLHVLIPLRGTNRTTFNMSPYLSCAGTYKADYGSDKVLSFSGTSGSFGRSLLELNDGALCLGMCSS